LLLLGVLRNKKRLLGLLHLLRKRHLLKGGLGLIHVLWRRLVLMNWWRILWVLHWCYLHLLLILSV